MEDIKNIIIEPLLSPIHKESNEVIIINNNNECIICKSELIDKDLLLINNFCECFEGIKICYECFLLWFLRSKKCIICREYIYHNIEDISKNSLLKIYDSTLNRSIYDILKDYEELKNKCNKFSIAIDDITIDIDNTENDNNSVSDITNLSTNDFVSTYIINHQLYLLFFNFFLFVLLFLGIYNYKM